MDYLGIKRLFTKAGKWVSFYNSPDFQDWKKEVVDKRLESYIKQALNANVYQDEGRNFAIKNIERYQELKHVTEDFFNIMEDAHKKSKKEIEKLESSM